MKFVLPLFLIATLFSCGGESLENVLTITEDGLSYDNVYLSNATERIDRIDFVFGETIYLNFSELRGYQRRNNKIELELITSVEDELGNAILLSDEIIDRVKDGHILFNTKLTIGEPMEVGKQYKWFVNLKDVYGEGTLQTSFDFNVIEE